MDVRRDDLTGRQIAALLERHLEFAAAHSPPESIHALGIDALRAPDITVFTAWEGATLLGCGALKDSGRGWGEIKSMHTLAEYRGRGVARAILETIVAEARRRGYRRLNLETGASNHFASAWRLYESYGFRPSDPFGGYGEDENSLFMTVELTVDD